MALGDQMLEENIFVAGNAVLLVLSSITLFYWLDKFKNWLVRVK